MTGPHRTTGGRRRALATLAGATLVVAAAASCTVSTNDEPVALGGSVPFGLLDTTTSTTTTSPEAVTKAATVYFLRSLDGTTVLTATPRRVDVAAGVQEVLANLFTQRPSDEEPEEVGLSTAIPESATLLSAEASESRPALLVVDVRGLFGSLQGEALRNALAQIVWTATELDGVDLVEFRRDGEPAEALVDDLESTQGPVSRADYAQRN